MKYEVKSPRKHQLFLLPGLGIDTRVYDRLLTSLPHDIIRAEWLIPEQNETLSEYASRQWIHNGGHRRCIVLGMSFGGIVAQELSKFHKLSGLVLISTLASNVEKSFPLHAMKYVPYYRLLKGGWRVAAVRYGGGLAGIPLKSDREFLADMLSKQSNEHRMWGYQQIIHWNPVSAPEVPTLRLHGARDRVFPLSPKEGVELIPKGTHFMLHQQAEQLVPHIQQFLQLL
ncbi:MAG: alpha/beta hydrolase [Bacteroidota bacterium]